MPMVQQKPKILFTLTVDTEEEWDWSSEFPDKNFSVDNIQELPAFQNHCQNLGVKPTYLVDYAVADNVESAAVLKSFPASSCEIGAHLHPWANPPFFNENTEYLSHVINLPIGQVKQKLEKLIKVIETNVGVSPKSFRTGRWGINSQVLSLLAEHGIEVDTSVYPFYKNEYFSCENAPSQWYWPSFENSDEAGEQRNIIEIPVTCGFNRSNYYLSQLCHKIMESSPFSSLRLNGLLWHTLLLRKLYLSPELCSAADMKRLIKMELKRKQPVLHMYLHSSSLLTGVTGLNNESNAREAISRRISATIQFLKEQADVTFCTLSEAKSLLTEQNR